MEALPINKCKGVMGVPASRSLPLPAMPMGLVLTIKALSYRIVLSSLKEQDLFSRVLRSTFFTCPINLSA
jgi:hypothetical protein